MPVSAMQRATSEGPRSILAPSASRASALPQREVLARLPCFAIRTPDAARTKMAAVDMLKRCRLSPPVPQSSPRGPSPGRRSTVTIFDRITPAIAARASGLHPGDWNADRKRPASYGAHCPSIMISTARAASAARTRAPPASRRPMARSSGLVGFARGGKSLGSRPAMNRVPFIFPRPVRVQCITRRAPITRGLVVAAAAWAVGAPERRMGGCACPRGDLCVYSMWGARVEGQYGGAPPGRTGA